ncbi:MAG: sensor histidine kinase [Pseudomonadota bacterium]
MTITPTLLAALAWMILLGWGFHALLKRHLRLDDKLADIEAQLAIEIHARAVAERALANTHVALCKLARKQESVRENERRRIGRDIHDDLGQNLLALKIDLSLLHVSTTGAHPLITQKVDGMIGNLDTTIRSLRAIINDLRPLALESGLRHALEWQLSEFTRLHGVQHAFSAEPCVFEAVPDRERDAMVFRIMQESLSNIARHSHATEVSVDLRRCGDLLTLDVRDNGVGMAPDIAAKGSGLLGIRDRISAIGGQFSLDSSPGKGTVLSMSIPLTEPFAVT